MVVDLRNFGPLLPSSMATCGMVGAGGKSLDYVPYLIAAPHLAACEFKPFKGLGKLSSLAG